MSIYLNLRVLGKLKPHQFFFTLDDYYQLYLHHQEAVENEDWYVANAIAAARNKIFYQLHPEFQQRPEVVK